MYRTGICHICKNLTPITYCSTCHHWFCDNCKQKWLARGVAAIKHWLGPKTQYCCGPTDDQ